MKALIDLDGCISLTNESLIQTLIANGHLEAAATVKDIKHWDIRACFPHLDEAIVANAWSEEVLNMAQPCEYLRTVMTMLGQLGVQRDIVTARQNAQFVTERWLEYHGIPHETLSFVAAGEKANHARFIGYALAIEDHLPTAIALAKEGIYTIVVAEEWNDPLRALGHRDLIAYYDLLKCGGILRTERGGILQVIATWHYGETHR